MKNVLIPAVIVVIAISCLTCRDLGVDERHRTASISEDYSQIVDPKTRWQAYGLRDYVIDQQHGCFCPDADQVFEIYVRNNDIVEIIRKSDHRPVSMVYLGQYKTIDDLFTLVTSIDPDSVDYLSVIYDTRFGFPCLIVVNPDTIPTDGEYSYSTSNIRKLLR